MVSHRGLESELTGGLSWRGTVVALGGWCPWGRPACHQHHRWLGPQVPQHSGPAWWSCCPRGLNKLIQK